MHKRKRMATVCALALLACAGLTRGGEIYTNRTGGGDWDDPATWIGGRVPAAEDVAVISRDDSVVFARNDAAAITCKDLHIDGGGSLVFRQNAGDVTLTVGGVMQSSGALLLDGTRNAREVMAIRFVSADPAARGARFLRGGSLVLRGAPGADGGEANVRLVSCPPDATEASIVARVTLEDGTGLDMRYARLEHVAVSATDVDNTGAERNERVNVTDCHFLGQAELGLYRCDSPVIRDCRFERKVYTGANNAMVIHFCPLAEMRNISIQGPFYYGLNSHANEDAFVENLTIDGAYSSLYWYGGGAMIRNLTVRNTSTTGIMLNYMSGMIDGLLTENCAVPITHNIATAQVSNWRALAINEADPVAVVLNQGRLTLLNCDIKPEWVRLSADAKPLPNDESTGPLVQAMQFAVVRIEGSLPARCAVEVRTHNPVPPLKPGQMDLNVRNSPAPVAPDGLTPLPDTQRCIVVAAWSYGLDRTFAAAPTYTISACGPPDADGARATLKSLQAVPDSTWHRPNLNDPQATATLTLP